MFPCSFIAVSMSINVYPLIGWLSLLVKYDAGRTAQGHDPRCRVHGLIRFLIGEVGALQVPGNSFPAHGSRKNFLDSIIKISCELDVTENKHYIIVNKVSS